MPEKITWSVTAPPLHWNVLNSDGGGAERTVKTFTCLCRTIILCLESWNSSVSNWAAECSTPVSRLKASRRWRLMEETDLQQLPQQQQQQHLLLWKVLRASEVDSSHFLFYFFYFHLRTDWRKDSQQKHHLHSGRLSCGFKIRGNEQKQFLWSWWGAALSPLLSFFCFCSNYIQSSSFNFDRSPDVN